MARRERDENDMTGRSLLRAAAAVAAAAALWLPLEALSEVPPGWSRVGYRQGFQIEVDAAGGRGGTACVRLQGIAPEKGKWIGVGQVVDASPWRGKRLRLSAWIRSEGVEEWGSLYFRIDDENGQRLDFGNNRKAPAHGTTDWRRYQVELDVPDEAAGVAFGVHLNGRGVLWADDFALEPVEAP